MKKNGIEVRKNGNVIERRPARGGYVGYDVKFLQRDGTFTSSGGNPWDYLGNARKDADGLHPENNVKDD